MTTETEFEIVFRGTRHGPFAPLDAARFVHANVIPLNAAVRVIGQKRVWPLRRFPALAEASRRATSGQVMASVREHGDLLSDGADYTPNHLSAGERFLALFWGVGLVVFTLWGIKQGQIPVVGGTRGATVMIGGAGLWLMAAANFLFAVACVVSLIDHFDRRNNETAYRTVLMVIGALGLVLMVLAVLLGIDESWAR